MLLQRALKQFQKRDKDRAERQDRSKEKANRPGSQRKEAVHCPYLSNLFCAMSRLKKRPIALTILALFLCGCS